MIAGRFNPHYGRAKNSWLTGSASWSFVALSEYILGIRADYDGLLVKPCLPKEMKEVKVTRIFRGKEFHITVHNTGKKKEYLLNGRKFEDGLVKIAECRDVNTVEITL